MILPVQEVLTNLYRDTLYKERTRLLGHTVHKNKDQDKNLARIFDRKSNIKLPINLKFNR